MDPTPWTQGIPIPKISSSTALGQCYFKFMDGIGTQILRVSLCPLTSRNCIWGGENPASGNWWDFERKIKGYLGLCQVGLKCKKQLFKEIETSGRFLKCHGNSWVFLCHHKPTWSFAGIPAWWASQILRNWGNSALFLPQNTSKGHWTPGRNIPNFWRCLLQKFSTVG